MMPRLEAERQIAQRTILLSAEGRQLTDRDARQLVAELERQKDGGERRAKKQLGRLSLMHGAGSQRGMGIQVTRVPVKTDTQSTSSTGAPRG